LDDDQQSSRGSRRDRDARLRKLAPDYARDRVCLIARATIVERGPITSTCAADVSGDRPQKRRAAGLEASRQ
jgi:hypothetical protein